MDKIILTLVSVEKFAIIGRPAKVSISKSMISFNHPATNKLALKKSSFFSFESEDGKLYYKDSSKGFEVVNETKQKSMNAYAKGVLAALLHHRIIKELKTARFSFGEFKEGRWELILETKKA